jgi:hypothetical protein
MEPIDDEDGAVDAVWMDVDIPQHSALSAREKILVLNMRGVTPKHQPTILSYDNQATRLLPDRVPHLFPLSYYVRLSGPLHTGPCQSPSHTHTLEVPRSISFTRESALTRSDSSLLICHHVCNAHLRIHS